MLKGFLKSEAFPMLPSRDIVKVQSCLSTENSPCQDNRQGLARPGARPCPGGLWATPKTRRPPCSFFRAVPKTRRPPYPVSRAVPKTRRPPYPGFRAGASRKPGGRPPGPVGRRRRLVYTYNMQTRIIKQGQCALALLGAWIDPPCKQSLGRVGP